MAADKHRLALPGTATEADRVACEALRSFYELRLGVFYAVRANGMVARPSSLYDKPSSGVCAWYQAISLARKHDFNPMWGVMYVMERALVTNYPPNAFSLASETQVLAYQQFGPRLYSEAATAVTSSIPLLGHQLEARREFCGLSYASAIDMVRGAAGLDPVIELLWRDLRGVESTARLRMVARLAYACCPAVYSHPSYPADWVRGRKLARIYEVKHEPVVQSPAVDGLFVAK